MEVRESGANGMNAVSASRGGNGAELIKFWRVASHDNIGMYYIVTYEHRISK